MTDSLLTALALVRSNWDSEQKSPLDSLVPFVGQVLSQADGRPVTIAKTAQALFAEFGLKVPQDVVATLLGRATRLNLCKKDHGRYYPISDQLGRYDMGARQAHVSRCMKSLVTNLQEFSARAYKSALEGVEAEQALLDYVDEYSIPLLRSMVRGTHYRAKVPTPAGTTYVVDRFILHLLDQDPESFNYVQMLVEGSMFASALFYMPSLGSYSARMHNHTTYLDTSLLLKACGHHGSEEEMALTEMLELGRSVGCKFACFNHTLEEVENVLEGVSRNLRPSKSSPSKDGGGRVRMNAIAQGLSSSDMQLAAETLESRLEVLQISVKRRPEYTSGLSVDENSLEEVLQRRVNYNRHDALVHDLDAVTAVYRLRAGERQSKLEDCKAVFLTSNRPLVDASKTFFGGQGLGGGVPLAMLSYHFTTLLWLKAPNRAPDLPRSQIIAKCYASSVPSPSLWRRYLDECERLQKRTDITADDLVLLRYSLDSQSVLMDSTLGQVDRLTSDTVQSILTSVVTSIEGRARASVQSDAERVLDVRDSVSVQSLISEEFPVSLAASSARVAGNDFANPHQNPTAGVKSGVDLTGVIDSESSASPNALVEQYMEKIREKDHELQLVRDSYDGLEDRIKTRISRQVTTRVLLFKVALGALALAALSVGLYYALPRPIGGDFGSLEGWRVVVIKWIIAASVILSTAFLLFGGSVHAWISAVGLWAEKRIRGRLNRRYF